MKNDIDLIKKQLKDNIQQLVDNGDLKEAKQLIEQYKNIAKDDVEVYSMDAIILIMEGKIEQAEQVLREGLSIDGDNFDLNYNLGYTYEKAEKFNLALECYEKARSSCNDEKLKEQINSTINEIKDKYPETINNKLKLVFFVKQGMDSFLGDIIDGLSDEYITKKVIITDYKQIDKGMEWADICWFEWCDELIIYGSKLPLARKKKIICRLHSYEAFTDYLSKVDWNKVDKLIFVGEHIRKFVANKFKINNKKISVIPNGININKWTFRGRKLGFNIAYVGYINYKKGPMLLLHTFKAIYDSDNRYKLYIAGKFQDDRDILYFKQMISEFGIEKNVICEGWQNNLDKWLEDKNYILCTSILESQNMSVMQAMAKGIKPIVHNFVGAKNVYPKKYVWNTIDQAINRITNDYYSSEEYRKFIEDNYLLDKQLNEIKKVLSLLSKQGNNKSNNILEFQNKNINIKFYLPFLNDWIQSIIYNTKNFYEINMLEDVQKRIGENKSIVDIGANIGNHTIYFSKVCKAKNVYSFEPQKNIFNILKKNVQINNVSHIVKLFNMGLGKSYSHADVIVTDKNNYGSSRLNKSVEGKIEIDSLDNILIDEANNVDMIKIDVEGMELEVLKGATKILKKFNPLIYIEAGTSEEFNIVSNFLSKYRYKPIYRFNATPTYLFVPS